MNRLTGQTPETLFDRAWALNVLGQVQPFTNGKQSVSLNSLAPGKYVFYCTVPGHREAGMQGNLTVLAAPNKR